QAVGVGSWYIYRILGTESRRLRRDAASSRLEARTKVWQRQLVDHHRKPHAGDRGKCRTRGINGHERLLFECRVVALWRFDTAIGPLVERDQERAEGRRPAIALSRPLTHPCGARRVQQSGAATVLITRSEIEPHVGRNWHRPSLAVVNVQ